jgi:hypothetical protein
MVAEPLLGKVGDFANYAGSTQERIQQNLFSLVKNKYKIENSAFDSDVVGYDLLAGRNFGCNDIVQAAS